MSLHVVRTFLHLSPASTTMSAEQPIVRLGIHPICLLSNFFVTLFILQTKQSHTLCVICKQRIVRTHEHRTSSVRIHNLHVIRAHHSCNLPPFHSNVCGNFAGLFHSKQKQENKTNCDEQTSATILSKKIKIAGTGWAKSAYKFVDVKFHRENFPHFHCV